MSTTSWRTYEEVAAYILNEMASEFGLERVEGKQRVRGRESGTTYEIDAKGTLNDDTAFIIIECRRHTTSRINQEQAAALAYRIRDTGAKGGIIVSPLGLQEGAKRIANAERIRSIELSDAATRERYILRFLNDIFVKITDNVGITDNVSVTINPSNANDNGEVTEFN